MQQLALCQCVTTCNGCNSADTALLLHCWQHVFEFAEQLLLLLLLLSLLLLWMLCRAHQGQRGMH
jgi:hypothetical protein